MSGSCADIVEAKREAVHCVRASAELPDHLTPRSMWHTFACLRIARDSNPKWRRCRGRQSSINVTLDTYAKWWDLEDHAAADALGALVRSEVAPRAC